MSDEVIKVELKNHHETVMHKLRNIEQSNNFMYEEIKDVQKRIKYMVMGALSVYALTQGGLVEFIKGLM